MFFYNQTSLVNIYVENATNLQSRAGPYLFGGMQPEIKEHWTEAKSQGMGGNGLPIMRPLFIALKAHLPSKSFNLKYRLL